MNPYELGKPAPGTIWEQSPNKCPENQLSPGTSIHSNWLESHNIKTLINVCATNEAKQIRIYMRIDVGMTVLCLRDYY